MKRIILRMSALGAVVALGLIAIAQAQRSGTEPATTASQAGTAPAASAGPAGPIGALAAGTAPRPLPVVRANPLRAERAPATAGEGIPTSGTSTQAAPSDSGTPAPTVPALVVPANEHSSGAADAADSQGAVVAPRSDAAASGQPKPLQVDPFAQSVGPRANSAAGTPAGSRGTATEGMAPTVPGGAVPDASEPGKLGPIASVPLAGNGTGTPGSKQLEGAQAPQVTVEKLAPAEIQVGKPATFRIKVRNSGQIPAHGVEIHDEIPKGTRLISTTPQASQGVGGELVWSLGTMQPGEEMTAEVQLMPVEEGEIGSVATVRLHAQASARSISTKPELLVEAEVPSQVLVGEPVLLSITVSNPGSGVATGVVLEERVPPGLQHPAGTELEYDVGELKPKETRKLQLQLTAERPGAVTNVLVARGDANLKAESRQEIQVLAPQLDIAVDGPKRRYLEREAAYTLAISNPGTAPAQRVELIAQLPPGLKFVSANNAGQYHEASHTVHWQLDELPVQETGTVKLVTMPVEPGEHKLHIKASAEKSAPVEKEQEVVVEGIAAIMFEVVDVNDPVEKGGETTYEIRVVNQGSKAATNVQLTVLLPPQMRPIAAEGPTHQTIEANRVLFEGLARLAPKADTTYRVRVQCLQAGDLRINVQLVTDEIRAPVTKEESTRVYADE